MLSDHFSLDELQRSSTAERANIKNIVPEKCQGNLWALCTAILEPIREAYGAPVFVNSGYRCPELNKLVKGAVNSYHLQGRAADVRGSDIYRFKSVVRELVDNGTIKPTEYIEYPTFIHIAL